MTEQVAYWNQRASLGATAGTRDLIAVELERRAIECYVKDGMRVLDVGCGTGETALRLASKHAIEIVGIDRAPSMIWEARQQTIDSTHQSIALFNCVDLRDAEWARPFDLIYTQRCLINLPDWPTQRAAIERILSWLRPGGTFLAVECCQDGLDQLNGLRVQIGLPTITPPVHNRYLHFKEVEEFARFNGGLLVDIKWYSSTYYFLSRVVNAKLAANAGQEPAYDSPINNLALLLPGDLINIWGQGVMWVWRR